MFRLFRTIRGIGAVFLLAAIVALLAAWGLQNFMHLVPCELCLWERRPWRVLVVLGALILVIPRRWGYWLILLGLACLVISLGLSLLHIGVELGYWASPAPECHMLVEPKGDFQDWMKALPPRPTKPCDLPDYPFGLPLSLTTISGIYTALVSLFSCWCVLGLLKNRQKKKDVRSAPKRPGKGSGNGKYP
ncbi:disulfide bond formation protein B [Oecophyllibacter saccharovorans]|uniref:Disulfide bond formation protein B n=1 Tax=Oecophyllibacter saccharovorans TaxID=2558360 RepID=A0A506ULA6_9PROT|nr:disulfide bond formation protein B [Oecophyllibacter saccharovorans]QDH15195.1 disulfide bond formation protein B [Oecophyllibacter saccharovorans]TPW34032.1 disulfide bond formation protein B [Oecophyllibacter saccharovorans]